MNLERPSVKSPIRAAAALCFAGSLICTGVARADDPSLRNPQTAASDASAADTERDPALKFANGKEKAELQAFAHRLWTLIGKERRARDVLEAEQQQAVRRGAAAAFRKATANYAHTFALLARTVDTLRTPRVDEGDGQKGMDLALINAQDATATERAAVKAMMHDLETCGEIACMKPARRNDEADASNNEAVLFLNRTYGVYGYDHKEIDPSSLTLRPGAKPSAYMTMNGP